MIYLRPIKEQDLDGLVALISNASLGLTTLPKDRKILEHKVLVSIQSFRKEVFYPEDEHYLFVLEDLETDKIIGVSAIDAITGGTGGRDPLYFYKKEFVTNNSTLPQVTKIIATLTPVSYAHGPSEVCSLYLHQDYRKHGLGRLLSLARFHFIASFSERFTESITAELRGVIENNVSPFWEGVGRHFFDVTFEEAMEFLKYGRNFIKEFLPKYPIYIPLLAREIQDVISQTHTHTKPALSILQSEGFVITDEVDIFDAGPKLKAIKREIRTLKESIKLQIIEIAGQIAEGKRYLLSNERLIFRACIGSCIIKEQNQVLITKETADALQVGLGDEIRISTF
jgi:arginine N-succinyltransferase